MQAIYLYLIMFLGQLESPVAHKREGWLLGEKIT
jgi:hypothetical protein